MKIDIVIPTYNRAKKLKRCLDSIISQTYTNWECCVIINGQEQETFDLMLEYSQDRRIWFKTPGTRFVVDSWNYYFEKFTFNHPTRIQDAVMWIVDDVELYPNCIEMAVNSLITNYPDTDGVVGIAQECPGFRDYTFKWFGQCLLGRKFIERYKPVNYRVCCPDYTHFYQDEEMWMFARSLGKFTECGLAILKHFHPCFIKEEMDDTHPLVRGEIKRLDTLTYNFRRGTNHVWGQDFFRVKNNH